MSSSNAYMGYDYDAEGTLLKVGTTVIVEQSDPGGWALVQISNGSMLWVPTDFIKYSSIEPELEVNPDYQFQSTDAPPPPATTEDGPLYDTVVNYGRQRMNTLSQLEAEAKKYSRPMSIVGEDPEYSEILEEGPLYDEINPASKQAPAAPSVDAEAKTDPKDLDAVFEWLASAGLAEYFETITKVPRFSTLEGCTSIDEDDALNEFCITDSRHLSLLLAAVKQLEVYTTAESSPRETSVSVTTLPPPPVPVSSTSQTASPPSEPAPPPATAAPPPSTAAPPPATAAPPPTSAVQAPSPAMPPPPPNRTSSLPEQITVSEEQLYQNVDNHGPADEASPPSTHAPGDAANEKSTSVYDGSEIYQNSSAIKANTAKTVLDRGTRMGSTQVRRTRQHMMDHPMLATVNDDVRDRGDSDASQWSRRDTAESIEPPLHSNPDEQPKVADVAEQGGADSSEEVSQPAMFAVPTPPPTNPAPPPAQPETAKSNRQANARKNRGPPSSQGIVRRAPERASIQAIRANASESGGLGVLKNSVEAALKAGPRFVPTQGTLKESQEIPDAVQKRPVEPKKKPPVAPRRKKKSEDVLRIEQQILIEQRVLDGANKVLEAYAKKGKIPKKGKDAEHYKKAQLMVQDALGRLESLRDALKAE